MGLFGVRAVVRPTGRYDNISFIIKTTFWEPCRYMQLSWNALSFHVTLPAFSSTVRSEWLLFCRLGALFLHVALLAGLVVTGGSLDISLCSFSFVETLVAQDDSACGSLSAV